MAKGDDAVMRKKSKVMRKRMRNSENSVSARVASIIASKRRRKDGKRRICEGMCFTLPTPEDPYNERHEKNKKKVEEKKKKQPNSKKPLPHRNTKTETLEFGEDDKENLKKQKKGEGEGVDYLKEASCLSKFLILCLNAIQDSWKEEDKAEEEEGELVASSWGANFWRHCSTGRDVLDTTGAASASREQLAWLVSTASDIITRKEKQGTVVASPFLLFLVPSQEKAIQVRSMCRPLKPLGVHTVSLHTGASVDHQIHGLKSCEPEFLISTPERLLELISREAIDISGASLLVLDGLKSFVDLGFSDKVKSIREKISEQPQVVIFSDCFEEDSASLAQSLLKGRVYKSSLNDSFASQTAFISQIVHKCELEEAKSSKALQILSHAFASQKLPLHCKVMLIAGSPGKAQILASKLKGEGYTISKDRLTDNPDGNDRERAKEVSVKDVESVQGVDMEDFEFVIFVDFPASVERYVEIVTKMARRSVAGTVHSFFCEGDAQLAQPLIKVLEQCSQRVPEFLSVDSEC